MMMDSKSPYEAPESMERVAQLRAEGRTDDEAHLIADGEFYPIVWIPLETVRH